MRPIGGDWGVVLLEDLRCCQQGEPHSGMTLVSILRPPRGTLRILLSGLWSAVMPPAKGASLRGSVVYVARLDQLGRPRMARPCDRCMNILKKYRVRKVVFTVDNGWDYYIF